MSKRQLNARPVEKQLFSELLLSNVSTSRQSGMCRMLKENRKKILTGTGFIADLNQNMLTNFSNRRIIYDKETNFGQNEKKQKEWELQIQIELTDLKEFSNE